MGCRKGSVRQSPRENSRSTNTLYRCKSGTNARKTGAAPSYPEWLRAASPWIRLREKSLRACTMPIEAPGSQSAKPPDADKTKHSSPFWPRGGRAIAEQGMCVSIASTLLYGRDHGGVKGRARDCCPGCRRATRPFAKAAPSAICVRIERHEVRGLFLGHELPFWRRSVSVRPHSSMQACSTARVFTCW